MSRVSHTGSLNMSSIVCALVGSSLRFNSHFLMFKRDQLIRVMLLYMIHKSTVITAATQCINCKHLRVRLLNKTSTQSYIAYFSWGGERSAPQNEVNLEHQNCISLPLSIYHLYTCRPVQLKQSCTSSSSNLISQGALFFAIALHTRLALWVSVQYSSNYFPML